MLLPLHSIDDDDVALSFEDFNVDCDDDSLDTSLGSSRTGLSTFGDFEDAAVVALELRATLDEADDAVATLRFFDLFEETVAALDEADDAAASLLKFDLFEEAVAALDEADDAATSLRFFDLFEEAVAASKEKNCFRSLSRFPKTSALDVVFFAIVDEK